MAFDPQLAPDEVVEHDITLIISKKPQLRLVLTDQAAYWPGKKTFAVSDPVTTIKVTPKQISEVVIGRKSRVASVMTGVAMGLIGLAWTFADYPQMYWVGYPQALVIGGIGVAVFGSRRFVLQIRSHEHDLRWVAPVAFGSKVQKDTAHALGSVGAWCKRHSVNVRVGLSHGS